MSPASISAPMRAFRPLSKRWLKLAQAPRRELSDRAVTRPCRSILSAQETCLRQAVHQGCTRQWTPRWHAGSITPTRAFSASALAQTKAIINPRQDDEGKDMLVEISARAANRLHAIAEKDSNPSLCLRVTVESGGCHGFQYLMSLDSMDKISQEEDVVFESEDGKNAKVVLDEPSLELLKGSTIDYTMELIGSQFKVTGIPGATSSCGCGSSFDIQA